MKAAPYHKPDYSRCCGTCADWEENQEGAKGYACAWDQTKRWGFCQGASDDCYAPCSYDANPGCDFWKPRP